MVLSIQRSITFPPIKLDRILAYLENVVEKKLDVRQLKELGLDIGRGKGDVTRFLERIGIVQTSERVELTKRGLEVYSLIRQFDKSILHIVFYNTIIQYKIFIDIIKKYNNTNLEDIYNFINMELNKISPTAWLNKVAFKTLVALALDLGVVAKEGGSLIYAGDPVERSVLKFFDERGVKIGDYYYVDVYHVRNPVDKCAEVQRPQNVAKLDIKCAVSALYDYVSNLFRR